MKLNLEIDIDWINEDQSIDDTIKNEIINGVMNSVGETIKGAVNKKLEASIDKLVEETIATKTAAIFDTFMDREVVITDSYGSTIKTYANVTEVIKFKFDSFLTATVDEKGNPHHGYGAKFTRIEFMIDKQLKDLSNKFTTDTVKSVSEEIKVHVQEGLKNKLGAELMKVLKVEEMLKLNK